jgi:hypothetical protein
MDKNTRHRFDVDPVLEKISPHIPDEEINYLFSFRRCHVQGRIREFQSSQLYRAHLLAMIKGIPSFNKLCEESKIRRSFRDFCRFPNRKMTPTNHILSDFRDHLNPFGFEKIAQLITLNFLNIIPLPSILVAVPDATDMPAHCRGFAKKNANVWEIAHARRHIQHKGPQRGSELRRVDRALILWVIRSIPYASGSRSGVKIV